MDQIRRADWKRHSAPYNDFLFDISNQRTYSLSEVVDQAMESFAGDSAAHVHQGCLTIGREKRKTQPISRVDTIPSEKTELSTDQYTPGVLKVFGETILPGVQYKSVLASCRSTAQELVKQALERFGLPAREHVRFVLCDVVGRYEYGLGDVNETVDDVYCSGKWERIFARVLSDRDKPLLLQKFWRPIDGYSRRYELHERVDVTESSDKDDTSGLNKNARKILMSKLRPGAIPMFDASNVSSQSNGINIDCSHSTREGPGTLPVDSFSSDMSSGKDSFHNRNGKMCSDETDYLIPRKHPFFMNIRGFDVKLDKTVYVIKSKVFTFGNPNLKVRTKSDIPKFGLYAPDIEPVHCNVKVYRFKKGNEVSDSLNERHNYFLELESLTDNVAVNGHKVFGKSLVKSGDIISVGIYYVFMFKDCSKGFDAPLALPWLPVVDLSRNSDSDSGHSDLRLNLGQLDDESKSNTDESIDVSIAERMAFPYTKEKEDELVKYICAIIQQQNTCNMYSLTVSFFFSMCVEYASKHFERRQLKHLFLRILFTVRDSVSDTAKSLSANKFACTLTETTPAADRDQKLDRLLLWISNCVQLLLFLKHTFQLPAIAPGDTSCGKEDNVKHSLGQLITGLEEIIMFCFQQCVYTITKSLHPLLPALLESNPFNEGNSEHCSMEDIIRMFDVLAELTHTVMLHEGITRQLFTYLFFFTNSNVFNKLMVEESASKFYNWQSGVRIRANLSQLEDWATQNGLEDEFGQMFERLLAASELLATSKNTLVKYQWQIMKTHYQPLTVSQLYHILQNYQISGKLHPPIWTPPLDELEQIENDDSKTIPLSSHPPFALPDNCGLIDLVRSPEDNTFWNHLRRLKSLYGMAEDDSDSGFSISNTPRGSSVMSKSDLGDAFYEQENKENKESKDGQTTNEKTPTGQGDSALAVLLQKQKSRIPLKKSKTNPWSAKIPKSGTGVCTCTRSLSNDHETVDGHKKCSNVSADLMEEENRESLGHDNEDEVMQSEDKLNASLEAKSNKMKQSSSNDAMCGTVNKRHVHSHGIYTKNCNTLKTHVRDRSYSMGAAARRHIKTKTDLLQSNSMEDISVPISIMRRKPSASFEEAIEHGHCSDTNVCLNGNTFSGDESSKDMEKSEYKSPSMYSSSNLPQNGLSKHSNQSVLDSTVSDDVFMNENIIDNIFQTHQLGNTDNIRSMPTLSSFKPLIPSNNKVLKTQRTQSQKLTMVNFDSSSRRSSIELAQDDLYVNKFVKNKVNGASQNSEETCEIFPFDVFTEVSASTLAARKRHGSSLNVAPSSNDNSPRIQAEVCEPEEPITAESILSVTSPDEKKRMSPCPLFTVYLKKGDGGLGLGLIDGLHTPLRLAGIYIKKILPNSPASENGCLQVGDRILAITGKSVIGANYQSTMKAIRDAGDTLTLLVARGNDSMAKKVSASQV